MDAVGTQRSGNPVVDVFDLLLEVFGPSPSSPGKNPADVLYPRMGIGQIADSLVNQTEDFVEYLTRTSVEQIQWAGDRVSSITVRQGDRIEKIAGDQFVSSLPITELIRKLSPQPPAEVLQAANDLRFRGMVYATIFLNQPRIKNRTCVYAIDPHLPYLRYTDTSNLGEMDGPKDRTALTFEYSCEVGDSLWEAGDDELVKMSWLPNQEFFRTRRNSDLQGYAVERVAHVLPVHSLHYTARMNEISRFLTRFRNLHRIGASGSFTVGSVESSIESGLAVARKFGPEGDPNHDFSNGQLALAGKK
jgi:protoporphyrinogen oxidase